MRVCHGHCHYASVNGVYSDEGHGHYHHVGVNGVCLGEDLPITM